LTRHPNYFGDACIWWSFGLFALANGYWLGILASALMTFLLLKVSGVAMLERGMKRSRPDAMTQYQKEVNAFFPGWRRRR
ncbi:MAG: DUF1295 domain-containing protein, partial [Gammaproteobacteria bacterium]